MFYVFPVRSKDTCLNTYLEELRILRYKNQKEENTSCNHLTGNKYSNNTDIQITRQYRDIL